MCVAAASRKEASVDRVTERSQLRLGFVILFLQVHGHAQTETLLPDQLALVDVLLLVQLDSLLVLLLAELERVHVSSFPSLRAHRSYSRAAHFFS